MMTENIPCYPNRIPIFEETISSSLEPNSTYPTSFLNNLSILKDRVLQVQSLSTIFLAPNHGLDSIAREIPIQNIGTLIQEIIVTASSMMFACQQMALGPPSPANNNNTGFQHHRDNIIAQSEGNNRAYYNNVHQDTLDQWYGDYFNDSNFHSTSNVANTSHEDFPKELPPKVEIIEGSSQDFSLKSYDIIELDANDLLAKYTHYCQVCGKGFKRDANLRMHMRAHGDEYKSSAALSNPMKNIIKESGENTRKYSCPHEGCRWNKNHTKFQPLKSMICVKNHYKRSHCPKMYVCKRCNTKQFSVLSDLRTHEKHCGDLKWQCSCGTTFSRKDKLMGHVALFVGHTPIVTSLTKMGIGAQSVDQIVFDDSR